jgi:hypothetical protein
VDASVHAKAEGGEEPVGVPPPDGRTRPKDTSPDAWEKLVVALRALSPQERLHIAITSSDEVRQLALDGARHRQRGIDNDTPEAHHSDMDEVTPPKCRRHVWMAGDGFTALESEVVCVYCPAIRDETRKRLNKNNRARGATFERTVAKALGGRRTGPLGGRDDVVGDTVVVQTKKTINFSVRQARAYLDDLSRTYPTRTALVVHAEPGRDREAVVILRLNDWLALHGPDGLKETA